MPRYEFTGTVETVLTGLRNGVNATLHRDGHRQPDGSTVVARPGDQITSHDPYRHQLMRPVDKPAKAPAKETDR